MPAILHTTAKHEAGAIAKQIRMNGATLESWADGKKPGTKTMPK